MVLFKRKPVRFLPPADIKDDNAEVWHIPQTGEVFGQYEDYLARMDFYKQRRFNCQISGHSGLTFFEALKSETAGAEEIEQAFPEALKGPVLRRVQFQTVSRIDTLVDMVFEDFRSDYYPGEAVTVKLTNGERLQGSVREKTRFGHKVLPDGTIRPPSTKYFVSIDDREDAEAVVDDSHIFRDRKIFTKAVLRSFIKRTVTREAWNGAPWLVNHDYAQEYHIDTRIPAHLLYDNKLLERKMHQAQKRASLPHDQNGANANGSSPSGPARLPELKPMPKTQKGKLQHPHQNHSGHYLNDPKRPAPEAGYPIEDLALEPRDDKIRPPIKFMCKDPPSESVPTANGSDESPKDYRDRISMSSVGPLLETWDTLNVYCEIFKLDSFTFDDFVEAMCVASEETTVQLFEEIHCSVLKMLVSSEADGGKVNVPLPEVEDEDDEDEEEEEEEARSPTPEAERPPARATRSSLAKAEAERLAAELKAAEAEAAEPEVKHRAQDLLEEYEWIDHLRKRDFKDGGWEMIMVGLLHQLSKEPRLEKSCEELLEQLVPRSVDPTQETVLRAYANLDVNYRIQALQIICMLTMRTKAIRAYMEDCSETMTGYRKEKIEWQRQRKQAVEELKEGDGSDSEEDAQKRKNGRRPNDRTLERQRKRKEERERKEKAAEAAKVPKQSKQLIKNAKDIQKKEEFIKKCEDEVAILDNDLREADCPRTRVLGRDRFWNRYYWFERNGMPYGGLPDSSTASADYANACIWVQGPDDLEREGYIDLSKEHQDEYKAKHNMTVPERKKMEEGATSVFNAGQWGYYDDPESVDNLIRWLDPRGYNELKLRKEILSFKDKIAKHMENRKEYLAPAEKEEEESKEPKRGVATRTRQQQTPEPTNYRCLAWENTVAMEELGHLHSEPPPPPRNKKQAKKRQAVDPTPELPSAPKTRRKK
ncbi:Ankyrin repeat, PH and SEC7 domain containing protein secG [Verticillium dahliae VDG1]|nr:Ankyrin repeat, PH and SEC7 domain containing protein secG [Verticillium dahliae VDG1]